MADDVDDVDAAGREALGVVAGSAGAVPAQVAQDQGQVDAFISYSHADLAWVTRLAENLERAGARVFFDQWDILPGEVFPHRLDDGLRAAKAGILVVSPAALASPWARNEYAAMLASAVERGRPLIPVLLADAELPRLLAIRRWVDFRDAHDPATYQARVAELVAALRGRRPSRGRSAGSASSDPATPPGMPFHAEGSRTARLRIAPGRVRLTGPAGTVDGVPAGLDWSAVQRLRDLDGARARRSTTAGAVLRAQAGGTATAGDPLDGALRAVGRMLGERFLPDAVAAALAGELADAERRGEPLQLALEISDSDRDSDSDETADENENADGHVDVIAEPPDAPSPAGPAAGPPAGSVAGSVASPSTGSALADLPWETLTLPGEALPLALHPSVLLHRTIPGLGSTPAMGIPGPLRILAVIASPEHGGGELLDYERELQRILDAVGPARRRGGAYVRILNWGSQAAIRAALQQERFHVLHISCHATAGRRLLLEKEDGTADLVGAATLAGQVLVAGRGVPLVVLAGCSTALDARSTPNRTASQSTTTNQTVATTVTATNDAHGDGDGDGDGETMLPGLARGLLAHGVPAVLAMTAAVTDVYATDLASRFYAELAGRQVVDPLAALADARRGVEAERATLPPGDRRAALAEWATPALFLRGPSIPLYDPAPDTFEKIVEPAEPALAEGIVVRRVGDFVGRRAELRALLRALRGTEDADHQGASSGSGAVIHGIGGVGKSTLSAQLITDLGPDAGLVVSLTGSVAVDQILLTVASRLSSWCLAENIPLEDVRRRLVDVLRSGQTAWQERLALLAEHVLPRLPITLLLDNAEDLLVAAGPGGGQAFADDQLAAFVAAWVALPRGARLLVTSRFPLPVSRSTARRLTIHHLGPLSRAEARKLLWRLPGLDALSPTEQNRATTDVGGHPRTLEYLDALLRHGQTRFPDIADRLEGILTRRGITDPAGWLATAGRTLDQSLAESITLAVDDALLGGLLDRLDGVPLARRLLVGASIYRLPVDDHGLAWQISEPADPPAADPARDAAIADINRLIGEAQTRGATTLDAVGLTAEQTALYIDQIDRQRRPPIAVPDEFTAAARTLLDLGLLSPTVSDDGRTAFTVHRWTATAVLASTEDETVTDAHRRAATHWRWRVDVWPQDRLADITQLLEAGHHHLATGDLDQIERTIGAAANQLHTWGLWDWEERACHTVLTRVPATSRLASAFTHQLGIIAQLRGDYTAAEDRYRQSLTINEELGNRAGIATSYHQLGMIAQVRGDYTAAEDRYRQSLTIKEELGDRAGIARSYHQLGMIAEGRGDYTAAEDRYRQSLTINEELGNRAGIATSTSQLGVLFTEIGRPAEAMAYSLSSLTIRLQIGSPEVRINVYWLRRQRDALGPARFRTILAEHLSAPDVEAALGMLDDVRDETPNDG